MRSRQSIVIGIRSHVVAVDAATGSELWRTKLKSGQFVTTCVRDDRVYGGVSGELFCLDRSAGHLIWHNKLPRLGFGLVSFAGDPARGRAHDLIIGIKGHVVAIDATAGRELWRTKLPAGLSGTHVTVAIHDAQTVVAGSSGELFGLNRSVGNILWHAKLRGLGIGLVSLGSNETAIAAAMAQAQAAAAAAS